MNARWAMMAVAGICTTEILGIGGPWYEAGAAEYDLPINALLAVQFPVMGILELRRIRGWLATGKSGVNETFPWDPMGMNGDQMALDLDYVPLPANVKDQVRAAWKGVTDPSGKPIF